MKSIVALAIFFLISYTTTFGQCPPSGGGDFDGDLTITGSCTVSSDLVLKKKNLTITSTGSLTIIGDFDNDGNGIITLDGGMLTISGAFNNNGNGVVNVQNNATLDVGTDYFNSGNGTSNFIDGTITIGENYVNDGNGNIEAGGLVTVGGDFTVNGNGVNTISGGISVGGTATLGSKGIDVGDGGVLQANVIVSDGPIDIAEGGTINVISGSITGTVNNDPGNVDQDCTNNCCGALCNDSGDDLGTEGQAVLPIELLYFKADVSNTSVLIKWATATELNNDYFTIERSTDGLSFETIATTDGAGNSTQQVNYCHSDFPDYYGLIYYRLKQTDFDGAFEQFQIIAVRFEPEGGIGSKIYPTVLKPGQEITIQNFWGVLHESNLKLTNLGGGRVDAALHIQTGSGIKLGTTGINPGVYLLSGHVNGLEIRKRVIIRDY